MVADAVSLRPATTILRWLINPCRELTLGIAETLLAELFTSPKTVLLAAVNGLLLNVAALRLTGNFLFLCYIVLDAILVAARLFLLKPMRGGSIRATHLPTDWYFVACISWCVVQGAMGFTAMQSGISSLQVVSAMTAVGLIGPICMRNFAAPRYALTMIGLILAPLVCGAALSGNHWLLVLVLQAPAFLVGAARMLKQVQKLTVDTLQAERDSQERALKDALTGLLNRTGLRQAIEACGQDRLGRSIFFYLDLDGFKAINDRHGHQAGDAVLMAVAGRLLSAVRTGDIVARLGGDEFMIVACGLSPRDGEFYAANVIRQIAETAYPIDGLGSLRLGISVGFACCPDDGDLSEELSKRADAALYEAKAAGKGVHRRYMRPTALLDNFSNMSAPSVVA